MNRDNSMWIGFGVISLFVVVLSNAGNLQGFSVVGGGDDFAVPTIKSVSSGEFKSDSIGYVASVVDNIGNKTGTFNMILSCAFPVVSLSSSQFTVVPAKESSTVTFPVVASVQSATAGFCTVKAVSSGKVLATDEMNVTVIYKPVIVCVAKQFRTIGQIIEQCNPEGTDWLKSVECGQNQVPIVNGTAQCIAKKEINPLFANALLIPFLAVIVAVVLLQRRK